MASFFLQMNVNLENASINKMWTIVIAYHAHDDYAKDGYASAILRVENVLFTHLLNTLCITVATLERR